MQNFQVLVTSIANSSGHIATQVLHFSDRDVAQHVVKKINEAQSNHHITQSAQAMFYTHD